MCLSYKLYKLISNHLFYEIPIAHKNNRLVEIPYISTDQSSKTI